jgi:hypothetical protein
MSTQVIVPQGYPLWVGWFLEDDENITFGSSPVVAWKIDSYGDRMAMTPMAVGLPATAVLRHEALSTDQRKAVEMVRVWSVAMGIAIARAMLTDDEG